VVATIADERDLLAAGRPFRLGTLAANVSERFGFIFIFIFIFIVILILIVVGDGIDLDLFLR